MTGSGFGSSGGRSCTGDGCRRAGIIVGSVVGSLCGLAAIVFGSIFIYCRCKGKPWRTNASFVNQFVPRKEIYQIEPFDTGMWSSRYQQYDMWHGPHQCSLQFDQATNRVTGAGNDDVGRFSIDGTFSTETHRMGLTKTYQLGTGDPTENSGHKVTIQLTWNDSTNRFEGKWYVQTKKYRGGGEFQLTLANREVISSEKVDSWLQSFISKTDWLLKSISWIYLAVAFAQAWVILSRVKCETCLLCRLWSQKRWLDCKGNLTIRFLTRKSPYRVLTLHGQCPIPYQKMISWPVDKTKH